jgi:hypothetical protein
VELGEKVLFTWLSSEQGGNLAGLKTNLGVIVGINNDGTYTVLYHTGHSFSKCKNVKVENICSISDRDTVIQDIKNRYVPLLLQKKNQLKTVSTEEKDKEKQEWYDNIKKRILVNAERMLKSDLDDDDFLNRVKELTNLKKQLFTNELKCISEIHRYNGTIKYEYRQLENEMNKLIDGISDKSINNILDF